MHRSFLGLVALLLVTLAVAGCQLAGWAAHNMGGGVTRQKVKGQYFGLENKTIAVIVAADDMTLFRYPNASFMICRATSARISDEITGARVVDPKQIVKFQKDNPYWNTLMLSDLLARLGVERMVYIDLVEYETHEAGNQHVGQGRIVGNVSVLEADAVARGLDADQFAFSAAVHSLYPEEHGFGVIDADMQTLELAVVSIFSRDTVRLFRDHVVESKR
jgi:hypothetical protein